MPYKDPEDKRRYMRSYMAKKRHDKLVENKLKLTGRVESEDLEPEPRTRKVDRIEDRPDFILTQNLKELYDELSEEDRAVNLWGPGLTSQDGPDPHQLDKEIADNDLIIDLDDLDQWETGLSYKKRKYLAYSRT